MDKLGRVTHDRVTTLGTGVDGTVRRVSTTYDIRGLREKITSYDNATVGSGTVINELVYEYNDAGQAVKEYQEHEGAKDASTLYVGYNYDTTAASGEYTKGLRPTSVRYPNARLVHFTYGSSGGTDDVLGRVAAIKDDSGGSPGSSFADYTYLGGGTIVVEDYAQPDVKLNYDSGTAGEYAGFDRFGRVVDHLWYDYGASADRDRFTYGYDRASSRLYRENTVASGKDEYYSYDDVNRLTVFDRGDLNANKDAISGTPVKEEDWGLDMTGNWTDFLQKTSGSTDLNQDRTHNPVNEITGITETVGTAWVDPVHDKAGNMTTLPKPSSLATGLTCKWDAWNRLVEVKQVRHRNRPLRVRRTWSPREVARGFAESGQSQRRGCLRALLLQPGLAGARVARIGQRKHRARVAPALVPVRLVAAVHRRPRAAGQEHGC